MTVLASLAMAVALYYGWVFTCAVKLGVRLTAWTVTCGAMLFATWHFWGNLFASGMLALAVFAAGIIHVLRIHFIVKRMEQIEDKKFARFHNRLDPE